MQAACGLQLPMPGRLLVFHQPPIFQFETEWSLGSVASFEMAKEPLNISESRGRFQSRAVPGRCFFWTPSSF